VATFIYDKNKGVVDKTTGEPLVVPDVFVMPRIHLNRDYEVYRCPVTDKPIEGRRAHSENLKRTGCRLLEKGEKEQNMRDRADADRKLERTVDMAVEKTASELGI
jgi:hypothetical protein